ncbi:MAG: multidrug transporter MdtH, partial [Enterobacterales bacterium]|nr:multidrug transporter MdtH [Enterobacterales bacterium]
SRLGLALGGAIGYTGGGWMYDTGQALGTPELPWFLLGVVGVLTLILLYWQFNQRSIAPAVLGGS